jgi:hypothetical protein
MFVRYFNEVGKLIHFEITCLQSVEESLGEQVRFVWCGCQN